MTQPLSIDEILDELRTDITDSEADRLDYEYINFHAPKVKQSIATLLERYFAEVIDTSIEIFGTEKLIVDDLRANQHARAAAIVKELRE